MDEIMNHDWDHIFLAKHMLPADKAERQRIGDEIKSINDWLTSEFIVDANRGTPQSFKCSDGSTATATVKQDLNVDVNKFEILMSDMPELQKYADLFDWNVSIKPEKWAEIPCVVKDALSCAVTAVPGEVEWSFSDD